jgi:hypothetical protein
MGALERSSVDLLHETDFRYRTPFGGELCASPLVSLHRPIVSVSLS